MNAEILKLLAELEEHGRVHDAREADRSHKFLNLEPETARIVSMLARGSRATRVLEIGTSNGYSTIWLAAAVTSAGGRVISIDRSIEKKRWLAKIWRERDYWIQWNYCVEMPLKLSRHCPAHLILCFSTAIGSARPSN